MGANLNVRINASGIEDRTYADSKLAEGAAIQEEAIRRENEILAKVNEIINQL
jgi:formiminotetrahydrofolate cyclodeaminase